MAVQRTLLVRDWNADRRTEAAEARGAARGLQAAVAALERDLVRETTARASLEERLARMVASSTGSETQLAELREELRVLRRNKDRADRYATGLQNDNAALTATVEDLTRRLNVALGMKEPRQRGRLAGDASADVSPAVVHTAETRILETAIEAAVEEAGAAFDPTDRFAMVDF